MALKTRFSEIPLLLIAFSTVTPHIYALQPLYAVSPGTYLKYRVDRVVFVNGSSVRGDVFVTLTIIEVTQQWVGFTVNLTILPGSFVRGREGGKLAVKAVYTATVAVDPETRKVRGGRGGLVGITYLWLPPGVGRGDRVALCLVNGSTVYGNGTGGGIYVNFKGGSQEAFRVEARLPVFKAETGDTGERFDGVYDADTGFLLYATNLSFDGLLAAVGVVSVFSATLVDTNVDLGPPDPLRSLITLIFASPFTTLFPVAIVAALIAIVMIRWRRQA